MSKSKKSSAPLQAPEYRGGKKALLKFVDENLKYPADALDNKIQGSVELTYVVNGLGKITEVKVLKGIGYGCDEEAVRLVKSLVYEKAYNHGLNTQTKRSLKIHFKLPKKKGLQLNYRLVSDKPKVEPSTPKPTTTYQIRIPIPDKKQH